MIKVFWRRLLFCALAAGAGGAGAADPRGNREIYLYQGADREARLVERAKKEGPVVLYSTMTVQDGKVLAAAFERKYGVKVTHWRGSAEKIVQRALAETRAGRNEVDVLETSAHRMEALYREKLLEDFHTPAFDELSPAAFPRQHRQYVADRFAFFVLGYNTNLIKPEEVPSSYEDLLHPRWVGRLAIESTDVLWFAALAKAMGEDKGLAYFRRLAAMKPMIRSGHILAAQLVASGEIPLLVTAYNNNIETLKRSGAPVAEADSSGVRTGKRHRPGQAFAAAARSAAVHRVRAVQGRTGSAERREPRAREPRRRQPVEQVSAPDDRPGAGPRRGGQVGQALVEPVPRRETGRT
jgi:iron(III) transport system substrate-binding protein